MGKTWDPLGSASLWPPIGSEETTMAPLLRMRGPLWQCLPPLRAASPFPLGRRDSPTPTATCCPTSPNPSFQPLTATRILQPKAKAWQTQLPELSESMALLLLLHFRKHSVRATQLFPTTSEARLAQRNEALTQDYLGNGYS